MREQSGKSIILMKLYIISPINSALHMLHDLIDVCKIYREYKLVKVIYDNPIKLLVCHVYTTLKQAHVQSRH